MTNKNALYWFEKKICQSYIHKEDIKYHVSSEVRRVAGGWISEMQVIFLEHVATTAIIASWRKPRLVSYTYVQLFSIVKQQAWFIVIIIIVSVKSPSNEDGLVQTALSFSFKRKKSDFDNIIKSTFILIMSFKNL